MNTTAKQIERLIRSNEAYYLPILERARRECSDLCRDFNDRPEWVSGWSHDFACPDCTAELIFDRTIRFGHLNRFTCPSCGKVVSSEKMDAAWIYFYRLRMAEQLESAAVCAVMGDAEATAFLERYFDFYADHYEGFELRGHESGRVMPQVLDEAVWGILILRALYPCRELFTAEKKEKWYQKLFLPLAALVNAPQHRKNIHNHELWQRCAAAAVALFFGNRELLTETMDSTLGVRDMAAHGFTADGLWLEGSPLYHYYALEGLTGFCQFLAHEDAGDPLLSILEKTYTAPLALSCDGWSFPSINDGWFPLTLERFADQVHRAAAITRSPALLKQVDLIRLRCPEKIAHPSALLIDCPDNGIEFWKSTNLAILRKPVHAILKSGAVARSHMHRDRLSVILQPFAKDLGTPGYAHELYKNWYQLAAAHNTVAVDHDQPYWLIPTHMEETEDGVRAFVDSGWEAVAKAERTLTPNGGVLYDHTEIICNGEHTIDWLFHAEGEAHFSAEPGEAAEVGDTLGYQHFTNVRRICCDELTASFTLNGETLVLKLDTAGKEVFAASSPGNPANELRTSIIVRVKADRAVFDATYTRE